MKTKYTFGEIVSLEMRVKPGRDIIQAASSALCISQKHKMPCKFNFNGVIVRVTPTDTISDAMKEYAKNAK